MMMANKSYILAIVMGEMAIYCFAVCVENSNCQNNGTCNKATMACDCPAGFSGPSCETEVANSVMCPPLAPFIDTEQIQALQKFDENTQQFISVNEVEELGNEQPVGTLYSAIYSDGASYWYQCSETIEWVSIEGNYSSQPIPTPNTTAIVCPDLALFVNTEQIQALQKFDENTQQWVPGNETEELSNDQVVGTLYSALHYDGTSIWYQCSETADWVSMEGNYSAQPISTPNTTAIVCPALVLFLDTEQIQTLMKFEESTQQWNYIKDKEEFDKEQSVGTLYSASYYDRTSYWYQCTETADWVSIEGNYSAPPTPPPNITAIMCPAIGPFVDTDQIQTLQKFDEGTQQWSYTNDEEFGKDQLVGTLYSATYYDGTNYWYECSETADWVSIIKGINENNTTTCLPLNTQLMSFDGVRTVEKFDDINYKWRNESLDDQDLRIEQGLGTRYWVTCNNGKAFYQDCSLNNGSILAKRRQTDNETTTIKGMWYPREDCFSPPVAAPSSSGLICPPLSMQLYLEGISLVKEFYIDHWTDVDFSSEEVTKLQTIGAYFWIGCANGASFTQLCQESYDGNKAYWFPMASCEDQEPPIQYLPSTDLETSTMCPSIGSRCFMDGVDSVVKYTADGWQSVTPGSVEMWTSQSVYTNYWIGCVAGSSFLQICDYTPNSLTTADWKNAQQKCPPSPNFGTPTCPPLKSHLSFDGVALIQKYERAVTGGVQLSFVNSAELSKKQLIGTQYTISCNNGATFTQLCGQQNISGKTVAGWNPEGICFAANGSSPLVPQMTTEPSKPACPALQDHLAINGVSAVDKYQESSQSWASLGLGSIEISMPQPVGTLFWIRCGNATPSFMEECTIGNDTAYWFPREGYCGRKNMTNPTSLAMLTSTPSPQGGATSWPTAMPSNVSPLLATTSPLIGVGSSTRSSQGDTQQPPFSPTTPMGNMTGNNSTGITYSYKVTSQMKVKKVMVPIAVLMNNNTTRRRRRREDVFMFEMTPEKWNRTDPNSTVYKAVKQTIIDQLSIIFTFAGFPISANNNGIEVTSLGPVMDAIAANYTASVTSGYQRLDQATITSAVNSAVSELKKEGAFAPVFGNDGLSLDIYDVLMIASKSAASKIELPKAFVTLVTSSVIILLTASTM